VMKRSLVLHRTLQLVPSCRSMIYEGQDEGLAQEYVFIRNVTLSVFDQDRITVQEFKKLYRMQCSK